MMIEKLKDSIKRQILERYSNIASLGEQGYCKTSTMKIIPSLQICNGIEVVGPSKEYVLEVAGQALDSRQGDSIDNETTVNATSVQISIDLGTSKILLVGDASTKPLKIMLKTSNNSNPSSWKTRSR